MVNTSYKQQNYNIRKSSNVQFTGNIGDKFVRDINHFVDFEPADVMQELKGTFGLKTEKVQDVIESFIGALRRAAIRYQENKTKLNNANQEISKIPAKIRSAEENARQETRNYFQPILKSKEAELAAAKKEIQETKAYAAKYEPMAKVKSIEEIDTIMPDRAIEIMDEMVEKRAVAHDSMFNFLMKGQGQEEALIQIERNNMLAKARQDGILDIPSVAGKFEATKYDGTSSTSDYWYTIQMIENALIGNPEGEYITSKAIREQVKKNAMALLTPMANPMYSNTNIGALEKNLDESIKTAERFHIGFNKGLNKLKNKYPDATIMVDRKPYDIKESKVNVKFPEDRENEDFYETFWQLSNYGNSNLN